MWNLRISDSSHVEFAYIISVFCSLELQAKMGHGEMHNVTSEGSSAGGGRVSIMNSNTDNKYMNKRSDYRSIRWRKL